MEGDGVGGVVKFDPDALDGENGLLHLHTRLQTLTHLLYQLCVHPVVCTCVCACVCMCVCACVCLC